MPRRVGGWPDLAGGARCHNRGVPAIPSRRWGAIALLAVTLGLMAAFLVARGSAAGADALAYWEGVRIWLAGGNPYDPPGLRLPYLYAPWLLPLFLPWAALPWPVAWFAWRAAMILGFGWSVAWAYRRRPGATAILVALLAIPLVATFDTGNVTLFLALGIWLAQFSGPRLGGALWALATAMKWVPIVLWPILPRDTRRWGLAGLGVAILLSIATWPQTLVQIQAAAASGPPNFPRPLRIDHAVLIWAAVPWLWREDLRATVSAALRWRPPLRRGASASAPAADAGRES
jgi:hypothetical protein